MIRVLQLEIKLEEKRVVIIPNIEIRPLDELIEAIKERISVHEKALGGKDSIQSATKVSPGGQHKLVGDALEAGFDQGIRGIVPERHLLQDDVRRKKGLVRIVGESLR